MSSAFIYSETILKSLEEALSTERLANYISLAHGDKQRAIQLYLWNAELSEALQLPVHILEVTVRNALHRQLNLPFGPNWFDNPRCPLKPTLRNLVQEVKDSLITDYKSITPPQIIAGLTMGFWIFLLSKRYETPLWRPFLYKAFPNAPRPLARRDVREALDGIRLMRNRIAHHEPILQRSPDQIHATIIEVLSWISTDTAVWLKHHSRFDNVWSNPP